MNLTGRRIATKTDNGRKTPRERRYNQWLHMECTCCVTGQPDFDIAHIGGYNEGKAMGRKSNLDTLLPLIRPLHLFEEGNRLTFWSTVGIPDYKECSKRLFGMFMAGDNPECLLAEMQSRVDREYVAALLGEIDY